MRLPTYNCSISKLRFDRTVKISVIAISDVAKNHSYLIARWVGIILTRCWCKMRWISLWWSLIILTCWRLKLRVKTGWGLIHHLRLLVGNVHLITIWYFQMCTTKVEFWYVYLSTKQSELKVIYFTYSDTCKGVVLLAPISLFVRLK